MNASRPRFASPVIGFVAEEDREERQLALEYVADAWNAAESDGVAQAALAHASRFAALTALVERHGEGPVAELVQSLPDRIRSGEYNLNRSLQ